MTKAKLKNAGTLVPERNASRKRTMLWLGLMAIMVLGAGLWYRMHKSNQGKIASEPAGIKVPQHIAGQWQRTDGGYVLEIRQSTPDGRLDVAYFNPNPINVSRAKWAEKDGAYFVMVELQDVNYPGSTYGLQYFPEDDRLAGTYYQAVEGQTYDVEFQRER